MEKNSKKIIKFCIMILVILILLLMFFIKNNSKSVENKTEVDEQIGETNYDEKVTMQTYFKQYIQNMVNNTNEAYLKLDSTYKEKRFPNYEQFEKYVTQNKEEIKKSFIVQYKIAKYADYKEYLCKDNYNNYYIFKEKEYMNYEVMLDQYTINDKIFLDMYSKQDKKGKTQMNLNKFEQMLNREDYTAAYNVLDVKFKEKYFESEEKFIKYIKDNFYKHNKFLYSNISVEEEKYKVDTIVSNELNSFKQKIVKRFKVELINNTNFSISFDV